MGDLKRLEVKYIRDGAKSLYKKDTECYICGKTSELQMHHFNSMTPLWEKWKKENNIVINSVDDVKKYRDDFVRDNHTAVYDEVVTLCKFHHMERLHKIYGQSPPLSTAPKQKRWCELRREKEYVVV